MLVCVFVEPARNKQADERATHFSIAHFKLFMVVYLFVCIGRRCVYAMRVSYQLGRETLVSDFIRLD